MLFVSIDEDFINKKDYELGRNKISNALALLNDYIKYFDNKASSSSPIRKPITDNQ
jgi:hypothetical protein